MYGKFFASTFTGSMFGAGPDVFAVWGYVIAHTVDSTVELNPPFLAAVLGTTPERISAAIAILSSPDERSRSKEAEGRRIVHESAYQYRVVNHAHYRALRNEEDRRAYNREAKQRERDRAKTSTKEPVIRVVNDMSAVSAYTEAEAETDTKAESKKIKPSRASRSADRVNDDFGAFWQSYPKKTGKGAAMKSWEKAAPPIGDVLEALKWQVGQPSWVKDGGQFIPHPATWINRRGWEDEPFHAAQKETTEQQMRRVMSGGGKFL